ncbi:hypothetical protein SUGI_0367520 [Cryptomeria japonica]|nr:hypothetical protein SUGI_0367520 [Cryptomeria japonica]
MLDSWNNILKNNTPKNFFYVNKEEAILMTSIKEERLQSITSVVLMVAIFDEYKFNQLLGMSTIDHIRYSTAGSSMFKNVQPFVVGYRFGSMATHNGELNDDKDSKCVPSDAHAGEVSAQEIFDTLFVQGSVYELPRLHELQGQNHFKERKY